MSPSTSQREMEHGKEMSHVSVAAPGVKDPLYLDLEKAPKLNCSSGVS